MIAKTLVSISYLLVSYFDKVDFKESTKNAYFLGSVVVMFLIGANFALMINQITTYMKSVLEFSNLIKENKLELSPTSQEINGSFN